MALSAHEAEFALFHKITYSDPCGRSCLTLKAGVTASIFICEAVSLHRPGSGSAQLHTGLCGSCLHTAWGCCAALEGCWCSVLHHEG